jgi:hypothetical protein
MSKQWNYTYSKAVQRVGRGLPQFGMEEEDLPKKVTLSEPNIEARTTDAIEIIEVKATNAIEINMAAKITDEISNTKFMMIYHLLFIFILPTLSVILAIVQWKNKKISVDLRNISTCWIATLSSFTLFCFFRGTESVWFRLLGQCLFLYTLLIYTVLEFFPSLIFRYLLIISVLIPTTYVFFLLSSP